MQEMYQHTMYLAASSLPTLKGFGFANLTIARRILCLHFDTDELCLKMVYQKSEK